MQTLNEAVVLALMVSAKKEKRFAHPAIVQKGSGVMIDGFHRVEAKSRLAIEGVEIYLGVEEYETNDPAGLAADINKTRRSWTTEEERRTQVQFLASQTDAEGNGFTNQQIADALGGMSEKTVRRVKARSALSANADNAALKPKPVKTTDGKVRTPAGKEELARAWAMRDSGMSTAAIAKDLGRSETTVRLWFRKERPEATAAGQPPTPPQVTQPVLLVTPEPQTPVAPLSLPALSQDIIKRERKSAAQRTASLTGMVTLELELEKLWKYAQNKFDADGRSVLHHHMGLANQQLVATGVLAPELEAVGLPPSATYEELLRQIDRKAKNISAAARKAIYLLGYSETVEP